MTDRTPNPTARAVVWIIVIVTTLTVLALIFFTDFPLWAAFVVIAVIVVPCQIYLNRIRLRR